MPDKPHIFDHSFTDLSERLYTLCEKPYQTKQILQWIFLHHTIDFSQMTNVSKTIQKRLIDEFDTSLPSIVDVQTSYDQTTKFLLQLHDDHMIEMVFMPSETKYTLCISTQVGCSRHCLFCATAKLGFKRNLSQAEILAQLMIAYKYFPDKKITNLVLMGMGEPLDNLKSVVSALKLITLPDGFCLSPRRVTLSTSGVIPMIYELIDCGIKLKLAISLNSAIDKKRDIIMPINKLYPLSELKKVVQTFRKHSAFRVTFEYIMIANFNMGDEDIKALCKFCGDISCKINLIKWNEVPDLEWKSPTDEQVAEFIQKLQHIPNAITLRKSRGSDIAGACGQLAGRSI